MIGDLLDRIKIFILPYGPLFFLWKTPIFNGAEQKKRSSELLRKRVKLVAMAALTNR